MESKLPDTLNKVLDYITSPGAVLPLLLLLILFIYYLLSTVGSLKDANKELKSQIRKDKDGSESGMVPPGIVTEPPGGKHVRIQEDGPKLDKANLLESDTSVLSAWNNTETAFFFLQTLTSPTHYIPSFVLDSIKSLSIVLRLWSWISTSDSCSPNLPR